MKRLFSAGIVVYKKIDGEIKYLLLRNAKGHWDFPKGIIEKGETAKEAALRELKEETGISATLDDGFKHSFSYFFTDRDGQKVHKTVTFFAAKADSTDVSLSYEHTDFEWLKLEDALKKVSFKESRNLLKQAAQWISK